MIKITKSKKILFIIFFFLLGAGIYPNIITNANAYIGNELVAIWHLDEGEGNIIYDDSNFNNNGLIFGANWTDGISGTALEFDGFNDYVSISNNKSLNVLKNITIEAWVYPYKMPWIAPIISKGTNVSNFAYHLAIGQYYSNGGVSFKLHSTGASILWLDSIFPLKLGKWYYITVVHSGNTSKIYINGILNNAVSYFNDFIRKNDLPLIIGSYNDFSDFFNGIIDEIYIYNRSLDSSEIYNNYNEILSRYNDKNESNNKYLDEEVNGFEIVFVLFSIIVILMIRYKKNN